MLNAISLRRLSSLNKRIVRSSKLLSTAAQNDENEADESKLPSLYCWGTNQDGSLPSKEVLETGRSTSTSTAAEILMSKARKGTVIDHPIAIDLEDAFGNKSLSIRDIECGPSSTAVILSDNTSFLFGNNKSGQLGFGDKDNVMVPKLLSPPDSSSLHHDQISQIKLGSNFSAIIDTNGDLYTMGYNGNTLTQGVGCLGQGSFEGGYLLEPTLVYSLVEDGCKAEQVAVGDAHITVLTDEGEVLVSGSGQHGKLGNLEALDQLFLEPVELLASEKDICQIACGKDFTLALTKGDGIIYSWGKNDKGQCGTGASLSVEMYAMEPMPVPIEGMLEGRRVVKIDAGRAHAAAITDKGELFIWGMGQSLQPELVTSLGHIKVVDISCGEDYTMILDQDAKVYTHGFGKTGVLGLASQKKSMEPALVEGMSNKKVLKISAGWKHAACLSEEM